MNSFNTFRLSPALTSAFESVQRRDPAQIEFYQIAYEVFLTIAPPAERHPEYADLVIIDRIAEFRRQIQPRAPWADDRGNIHVDRGFRVEYNSVLGPHRDGLRLYPPVNLSTIKFLSFEQIFKNTLTGLSMGGGKGGTDSDSKGKSNAGVMRFCQPLMTELSHHIGPDTDVPAGNIGVGGHEISHMFGQHKHLRNRFDAGTLADKGLSWGDSYVRIKTTGCGLVYFVTEVFVAKGTSFDSKHVVVSGSGNVVICATEKTQWLGATIIAVSDSSGCVVDEVGIGIALLKDIKEVCRGRVSDYMAERPGAAFVADGPTRDVSCDVTPFRATQNELPLSDVRTPIRSGVRLIAESANVSTTPEAIETPQIAGVVYAPGKASNAGGMTIPGPEMQQSFDHARWPFEETDAELHQIMVDIHATTIATAEEYGVTDDYVMGANLAGFRRVAGAMITMDPIWSSLFRCPGALCGAGAPSCLRQVGE